MKIDIEFMIGEGDKVDWHSVVTIKHIGEFVGIMPKGNTIRLPAISMLETYGEDKQDDVWRAKTGWYCEWLLGRHTSIYYNVAMRGS